jgi:hypothetical protein
MHDEGSHERALMQCTHLFVIGAAIQSVNLSMLLQTFFQRLYLLSHPPLLILVADACIHGKCVRTRACAWVLECTHSSTHAHVCLLLLSHACAWLLLPAYVDLRLSLRFL